MAIVQIQFRRDNTTNWTNVNPILASGEPAYDTVLKTLKIGDGTLQYNSITGIDFSQLHTHSQGLEPTDGPTFAFLSSSFHDFDELGNGYGTPPDHKAGRIWYDHEEGAFSVYNFIDGISLQIGQEMWTRVYNGSGADIVDGTPVFMSGSQGDNPLIYEAVALVHTHDYKPIHIAGMATHTIPNNTVGFITTMGKVHGLDTSAYTIGQPLFLTAVPGELSNTPPAWPYEKTRVGGVVRSHANDGVVFVTIKEPVHFEDIAGLSGSVESNHEVWVYDSSNSAWTNRRTDMDLQGSFTGSFSGSYVGDGSNLTGVGGTGDVIKVGTPVNKQLGIWTGDGTLEGDSSLRFITPTLSIGSNDSIAGVIEINGNSGNLGGTIRLSNGGTYDSPFDSYIIRSLNGNLEIKEFNDNIFTYNTSTSQWTFNKYGGGILTGTPTYTLNVDVNGNIIEGVVATGDVTKVGTPANTHVAVWTGDGTLGSDINKFEYLGNGILQLGQNGAKNGDMRLLGDETNGGIMYMYTSINDITNNDNYYNIKTTAGKFTLTAKSTGNFLEYSSATQILDLPKLTTLANASGSFTGSLNSNITAPTSISGSGTQGEIRTDTDYIYVCTATDTWKRTAITTW